MFTKKPRKLAVFLPKTINYLNCIWPNSVVVIPAFTVTTKQNTKPFSLNLTLNLVNKVKMSPANNNNDDNVSVTMGIMRSVKLWCNLYILFRSYRINHGLLWVRKRHFYYKLHTQGKTFSSCCIYIDNLF